MNLKDEIRLGINRLVKNPETGILEPAEFSAKYNRKTGAMSFMFRLIGDWEYYLAKLFRRNK